MKCVRKLDIMEETLAWIDILFLLFPVILGYILGAYYHSTIGDEDKNVLRVSPIISFAFGNLRKDGKLAFYGLNIQIFITWLTFMFALNKVDLVHRSDFYICMASQGLIAMILMIWFKVKKK